MSGNSIAEEISKAANDFAEKVSGLAGTDQNIRTGILKSAIRDVVWALNAEFDNSKYEIAEMLELMGTMVQEGEND
ncbi:MAG: hypothetical protein JJU07_15875 [Natronohydrobacter sp.]|nr:hypothetical protein [Natronohydrobacter sp.]